VTSKRSTARDGLANRLETAALTSLAPAWWLAARLPRVGRKVNRQLVNRAILKMPTRPEPLSTMAPYTSWESLTDRTFSGRHLPPTAPPADLPSPERVAELLFRRSGGTRLSAKSTVLFSHFAQWFTDGFLRSDRSEPRDPRRNTSTHEIDLCQLYGLDAATTRLLRAGSGGRLKSQMLGGEEFPPYLCSNGQIQPEFEGLSVLAFDRLSPETRDSLFAMGGDRANSQVGYLMLNVLMLREHNRIAGLLAADHPDWDDERLFQSARNVLIVVVLKIVVEEYINHIAPYHFKFRLDPKLLRGDERWYRPNWMAIEFNLLYRWHSLVPSTLVVGGQALPVQSTLFRTAPLVEHGLGALFEEASEQAAGRVGPLNTDAALLETEVQSVLQGRQTQLRTYNDYREHCGFPRVTAFDQISGDPRVQDALRELYGTVDRIELYAGLFAEDERDDSVLPPLIGRLVGIDAFSQALTNPLLAPRVFSEETFSARGLQVIEETRTLSDVLNRNVPGVGHRRLVSMTRRTWRRGAEHPEPPDVGAEQPGPDEAPALAGVPAQRTAATNADEVRAAPLA
jgi:prostaglandin-endoperoxide synthase 2